MSKAKRLKNQKVAKGTEVVESNKDSKKTKGKDQSEYIFQGKKLEIQLDIKVHHELSDKQKTFLETILDKKTNIVFLRGPAGTSKSYLAVLAALTALNAKTQSDILYIRSPVEVGKTIGHLPGEFADKIGPYLAPLYDKLDELISKGEADMLVKTQKIAGTIPNFLRGQSWNCKYIIVDEAQNLSPIELKTIITRFGKRSKLIFLADEAQSDIKGKVEFMRYFDMFNNPSSKEYGIHCLSFAREDIVRSPILGYILDRIEGTYTPESNEPMFAPQQ